MSEGRALGGAHAPRWPLSATVLVIGLVVANAGFLVAGFATGRPWQGLTATLGVFGAVLALRLLGLGERRSGDD